MSRMQSPENVQITVYSFEADVFICSSALKFPPLIAALQIPQDPRQNSQDKVQDSKNCLKNLEAKHYWKT